MSLSCRFARGIVKGFDWLAWAAGYGFLGLVVLISAWIFGMIFEDLVHPTGPMWPIWKHTLYGLPIILGLLAILWGFERLYAWAKKKSKGCE